MARDFISRWRHLARPFVDVFHTWRCRRAWHRGEVAGDLTYVAEPWPSEVTAGASAVWPGVLLQRPYDSSETTAQRDAWCRAQTLGELKPAGPDDGQRRAFAFYAPGQVLPGLDPSHLEAALLILAAEAIDAVTLVTDAEARALARDTSKTDDPRADDPRTGDPKTDDEGRSRALLEDETNLLSRVFTVYRGDAYRYDAMADRVIPLSPRRLRKCLAPAAEALATGDPTDGDRQLGQRSRGPYRSAVDLPGRLRIGVRDARQLKRRREQHGRPVMLVTVPFLARGGAEQTLFATLQHLGDRFDYVFVTLAPHRPALGDRRPDFRQLAPRLFSLGDWVHPAAMVGMIGQLIDTTGARILYNANGTTLFYDFAPRLKRMYPKLHIVDHLYDHRVGYIERYDANLLASVDLCVAENHPIQQQLGDRGWPASRAPVIWPCGRPTAALPQDIAATRQRLRRQLDLPDDHLVFLAALRMHPQKRPLDLVALAVRCADLPVRFLLVGGGELERQVDEAIAANPEAPIRRLPFRRDIPDLICAADVGCLVSDYEGLPVFLLECLQLGRPFLGTDVGELGRVLRDAEAGPVVDRPGDLDALERAVRHLIDPEVRHRLASRALEAAAHFAVEVCAERYAGAFLGAEIPPLEGVLRPPREER